MASTNAAGSSASTPSSGRIRSTRSRNPAIRSTAACASASEPSWYSIIDR